MKVLGIVRKVDELGRVVIPMELRKNMSIEEGQPLEILSDGKQIILRKYAPGCNVCGSITDITDIKGTKLCKDCINTFAKIGGACYLDA